jgi:ribosomal protein L11 methyltransferase
VALKPVLTQLLTPDGQLTLAGLLEKQAKEVIEAYAPDVALAVVDQREEWVLLSGRAV